MTLEQFFMVIKSKARKNKELSIVASLTVLAQVLVGQNQNKNISDEVAKVKSEFHTLRLEREQLFVKKDELAILHTKIDRLTERVADIQGFLKRSYKYQVSSCIELPKQALFILDYPQAQSSAVPALHRVTNTQLKK
jgi:hypothetical protein